MRPIVRRLCAVTLAGLLTALTTLQAGPAAAETATISGRVLDAQSGLPPAFGACVTAHDDNDGHIVATACIDLQSGAFAVDGLESGVGYRIEVGSGGDAYPLETWLPGGPTINHAVPVVAPAVLDIPLPRAGTLTGTLTRSDGAPAADLPVVVWLSDREEAFGRTATTAADGSWTIGQLYPTPYKVSFECCWPAWAYGKTDWSSADIIDLPAGQTVRVDDTFYLPATISGQLNDAVTGQPIEGACIELRSVDPAGGGYVPGCTDASGAYLADYVTPGQYKVIFYDPQGRYAATYYGGDNLASATVITVARGGRVTGVDGRMTAGATLTGRVVDSRTRHPVAGICPLAHAGRDGDPVDNQQQECSDSDGRWRVSALPARPTTIQLWGGGDPYGEQWIYNAHTQAKATVFTPEAGRTTSTRDVRLTAG
ncbi:MSCRAMM family protein [Micromonospora sp. DT47]|uniref:MSCRAMM family protein n=1 Tax=Micromonospora sp. DT47 TaxID=3393431 RepID=UPI003CFAE0DA